MAKYLVIRMLACDLFAVAALFISAAASQSLFDAVRARSVF